MNRDRIKHKTFITYHHDDEREVRNFIERFDDRGDVFITRGVGEGMPGDIIESDNTEYVLRRIRELYLEDSTVTLTLIGRCTWSRRYVDWEIQASLRRGETITPNGLIGVVLPSVGSNPTVPERLSLNLKGNNNAMGYARCYWYPQDSYTLATWIEDAYQARTKRYNLIENPRDRFSNNRTCP